jgi:1-acyl-sn-glycerol-3-phosphate acyltransferase
MQKIYTYWCAFWFIALFLVLFPFFWLFLLQKSWHRYAHKLNRIWGKIFFPICGIRFSFDYRFKPEKHQTYVFVSNHTSYVDIAIMGVLINNFYVFIGKKSITKVPLFGYMFKKLHLPVDRSDAESSYKTYQKSLQFLEEGRSMMVFIEGGIKTKNPPFLHLPLKDGAFRMAVEKQIPIVPITFPYNWVILPDKKKLLFQRHVLQATVHEPIETKGLTSADIEMLMLKTYNLITDELGKYYPEKKEKEQAENKPVTAKAGSLKEIK